MANTAVNRVEVFHADQLVGRLVISPQRQCLFEYDQVWLKKGFSISPFYLPLRSGVFAAKKEPFDGLFGVFDDSLPDGWGKLLIDRWLMKQKINPSSISVLDRLCLVGQQGMGALTYLPDRSLKMEAKVQSLDYFASEVNKILNENYEGSLEELVIATGSSGGARPKVLVNIEGIDWLIKFKAGNDPFGIGKTEYEYSQLAKKCRIEMPETALFEGKYFGTQRFDRQNNKRIHTHSAAGLLYASHRLPSLDYISLMKATLTLTRDINELAKMFRQMVFNVLIGNKDDHAKNFSFIYSDGHWKLSPAYDILPSAGFNNQHTTTVNGSGTPTLKDCLEVAQVGSFPINRAKEIIEEIESVVSKS